MPADVLHSAGAASVGSKGLVLVAWPTRPLLIFRASVAWQAVWRIFVWMEEVCRCLQGLICPPKVIYKFTGWSEGAKIVIWVL